jgi:hypothetical protein
MAEENKDVKAQLTKEKQQRDKSVEEAQKIMSAKPTPTQEENDRAMLGEDVDPKADDGSGPQPEFRVTRHVEADKPSTQAGYATRQAKPAAST